jgi:hypothetical protein
MYPAVERRSESEMRRSFTAFRDDDNERRVTWVHPSWICFSAYKDVV